MKDFFVKNATRNSVWSKLIPICLLLMSAAVVAFGQANAPTPNDPIDPEAGYSGPAGNAVQVDPINSLAYVNANASSIQYTDRLHGPLSIGVEARGAYADNVFDSAQQRQSGPYFTGGAPIGYRWEGNQALFSVNYRIDGFVYPGYSQLNSISQIYLHRWQYTKSDITSFYWNVAAGRVTSLGQYLPALIPIGGTGVTQPTLGTNVLENSYTTSNAITVAGFHHRLSDYTQIQGSVTGGWVEERQQVPLPGEPRQFLKTEPAGLDFQIDHLVTPKTAVGMEVTNVFIRGLAPVGHDDYTAVEPTFKHNFTPNLGMRFAAGPLFVLVSSSTIKESTVNYALSAAVDYTLLNARINLDYSRIIAIQYQDAPSVANQFSGVFDRALTRSLDLTVAGRYINTGASAASLIQTNYGITARLDRHLTPKLTLFVTGGRFQQTSPPVMGTNFSYSRDEASAGLSYLFGNPLERQGATK
jgi:hypothetical protein